MRKLLCPAIALLFALQFTWNLNAQIFNLPDSIETGRVQFEFNADSALLVVDYIFLEDTMIANGKILPLQIGSHTVELNIPLAKKETRTIEVFPDSITLVVVEFEESNISRNSIRGNYTAPEYFGSNVFIATDYDSEVYFDSIYVGTGFAKLNPDLGPHFVTIKNPDFGTKSYLINSLPFGEVYDFYRRPRQDLAKKFAYLPGASQIYKREYLKGAAFTLGFSYLLGSSIQSYINFRDEKDYFDFLVFRYNETTNESNALQFGNEAEAQEQVVNDAETKYLFYTGATVLWYALNIFDAYRTTPKGGYREQNNVEFYLSNSTFSSSNYYSATIKVNLQ